MRLDKFLKVSRLIKRRTVANEACDAGRVLVNGNVAKASVKVLPNSLRILCFAASCFSSSLLQAFSSDIFLRRPLFSGVTLIFRPNSMVLHSVSWHSALLPAQSSVRASTL